MKKIVAMVVMALFAVQAAMADDVVTRDVNKLPAPAREVIAKYFPQAKVSYIKIDKDLFKSPIYEATLTNGTEIEFGSKGEWLEVDCKKETVPAYFISNEISRYIGTNFAGHSIVQISRDRKGYDVELSNGLEVKFDRNGNFLRLDD